MEIQGQVPEPQAEWLTLPEAVAETGLERRYLWRTLQAAGVPYRFRQSGKVGKPAILIDRAALARWQAERSPTTGLPKAMRHVIVPMVVARRLVGKSKQHLRQEILDGRLRALAVPRDGAILWHFSLGDLSDWLEARLETGPWIKRRHFDPEVLKPLLALMEPASAWNEERVRELRARIEAVKGREEAAA